MCLPHQKINYINNKNIYIRLSPNIELISTKKFLIQNSVNIKFDKINHFYDSLKSTKLCIHTYNSKVILQCIFSNISSNGNDIIEINNIA